MSLLAANRRVLAARFPEALAPLETALPAKPTRIVIPEEAASLVAQAVASPRHLFVLSGIPGPATLEALRLRCARECVFWCVEPAVRLLAARLATEDLSAWLADPRVFLSLGRPSATALRRLNRELAWVDRARALLLPTRHAGHEGEWQPLLAATLSMIQQRWHNVFTDLRLSPVRWENTCANLDAFLQAPAVDALAGAFAGTTMVVVAAGPSLDDALPFLRQVAPHALIVTGNTSFRALASRGLSPHLTVTIDPFPATALGYKGQPIQDTFLVSPVFAYHEVHQLFAGRLFGMTDQNQLLARLRAAAHLSPAPELLGEGTVSATVLNLAAYFGCTQIVFVGQDFAMAKDGRSHATDTFYTDLGVNRQEEEQTHRLPGTTLPEVVVPARLLWYLRTVEGFIARHPAIRFLNTSHCGAAISGAPFAAYDQAAETIRTAPVRDFTAEIAARHQATLPAAIRSAIDGELARARNTMREALQLALATAFANELALADPARRKHFESLAQRFEHWRNTHPSEQPLLFEGCTKPEVFAAEKRRLQLPDSPDRRLREAGEHAWAFAEGSASVYRQLAALTEASA